MEGQALHLGRPKVSQTVRKCNLTLADWTPMDVADFSLSVPGVSPQSAQILEDEEITGQDFLSMERQDFLSLKIPMKQAFALSRASRKLSHKEKFKLESIISELTSEALCELYWLCCFAFLAGSLASLALSHSWQL